jgi:hypothetical protein
MASERKVKIPGPDGAIMEGVDVPIKNSSEPWTEVLLEDGTVMRLKQIIVQVVRIDGKYDDQGNPVYIVKAAPAVSVVEVPDALRKKD